VEPNRPHKTEVKARTRELTEALFTRNGEPGVQAALEYARMRRLAMYSRLRTLKKDEFDAWQGEFKAWDDMVTAITTAPATIDINTKE